MIVRPDLRSGRFWLLTLGLAATYWGLVESTGRLFIAYGLFPAPFWPAATVAMVGIWYFGGAAWLGIFLGATLANWFYPPVSPPFWVAATIAAGSLAGAIAANRILSPRFGDPAPFERTRHLVRFLIGAGLCLPAIAATVGTAAIALAFGTPAEGLVNAWLKWTIADSAGALCFSPILMLMLRPGPDRDVVRITTETFLAGLVTTLLAVWVYWFADVDTYAVHALPYLLALPLAWAALKFDLRVTATILLIKETVALFGTLEGVGALNATGDPYPIGTLALILVATNVSVFVVNVLVTELRRKQKSLSASNKRLEAQVHERTLKLAASEARYRSYFNASLVGLAEIAPDGQWVQVNNHLRFMLGYLPQELERMTCFDITHPDDRATQAERFNLMRAGKLEAYLLELRLVRKNGLAIQVMFSARAARTLDGALDYVFVVIDDISQRKAMEEELQRKATLDYLTGLANRRHFTDLANKEIGRAERNGSAISFLMFDVDRFKSINDSYGHPVGDTVLENLADHCRDSLRGFDIIGRVGGEEFAVLLPDTQLDGALEIAERLRRSVAGLAMKGAGDVSLPPVTISIGVAMLHPGEKLEQLFSRADAALYRAKQGGRNRVEAAPEITQTAP
ncbi:MAG: diguanylate cyclase [Parasulfuritortus sp.]|nr:diguanylate cyclase [Parasulfuritortus sp.]